MIRFFKSLMFASIIGLALITYANAFENVKFNATEKYKKKTVILRGELFKPKSSKLLPAVVLMHGCSGWQPSVHRALRTHARFLMKHGFVVLNLDSFGPRRNSGGWVCKTNENLDDAIFYRTVDAFDALKFLQTKSFVDPNNIFLMGQSNGGSVTVKAALKGGAKFFGERAFGGPAKIFRAGVAYYPSCLVFRNRLDLPDLAMPLLVFGGGRDDWASPKPCKKVENPEKGLDVIIYSKAAHSFDLNIKLTRYLGYLVGYNRHATLDSRQRMVAFFKKQMKVGQ